MKKLTAWIILGALAATIMVGCAAKEEAPADEAAAGGGAATQKTPTDADTP